MDDVLNVFFGHRTSRAVTLEVFPLVQQDLFQIRKQNHSFQLSQRGEYPVIFTWSIFSVESQMLEVELDARWSQTNSNV